MSRRAVAIVGVGADGCASLSARAYAAVESAAVLAGGRRQLDFFPQFRGERVVLEGGIKAALERLEERAQEDHVCVLASGDPMFFGVGALLARRFGRDHVEVHPQPSAVQWAFARIGVKWDDAEVLSAHGRSLEGFAARVRRASKVACFTDADHDPARLAQHLIDHGEDDLIAWVGENLAGPDERVRRFTLEELAGERGFAPLNMLVLLREDTAWRPPPAVAYRDEEAYAKRVPKKGLITKREVRALSLATLQIRPDSVVWDIGAGSGAVAIEAAELCPKGRVYAVEVDPEGCALCRVNARAMGADHVRVIEGRAPDCLADLEDPDAVFVGGSKGAMDAIVAIGLERLRPGGRLVVNAVTLDNVHEAYQAFRSRGLTPEVTLLQISRGAPLARYVRYEALNPIHILAVTRPDEGPARASA